MIYYIFYVRCGISTLFYAWKLTTGIVQVFFQINPKYYYNCEISFQYQNNLIYFCNDRVLIKTTHFTLYVTISSAGYIIIIFTSQIILCVWCFLSNLKRNSCCLLLFYPFFARSNLNAFCSSIVY